MQQQNVKIKSRNQTSMLIREQCLANTLCFTSDKLETLTCVKPGQLVDIKIPMEITFLNEEDWKK